MSKTKRILSLILCLATVLALFAGVTAFAADEDPATADAETVNPNAGYDASAPIVYADKADAEEKYDLAIQVLSKAGVITGYDEEGGKLFKPKGELTRAEAATFLSRLTYHVHDAKLAAAANPGIETGFNDTTGHWASWYIKQAAGNKLIKGDWEDGKGPFRPDDKLTIAQFEVMLLRLAGYGQAGEFTGADWAYNADMWAKKVYLTNDMFGSRTSGVAYTDYMANITREQAVALLYNLLYYVVEVSYQYGTYRDANVAGGNSAGKPVGESLGFTRGYQTEAIFGDIIGEYFNYDFAYGGAFGVGAEYEAIEGIEMTYSAAMSAYGTLGDTVTLFAGIALPGSYGIYSIDLGLAKAEKRITEVTWPTGPSTEQVRTAVRANNTVDATNWSDDLVLVNGIGFISAISNPPLPTASGFANYMRLMPNTAPAFGYEADVKVWAFQDFLSPTTPLRMTVHLPSLAQVGKVIVDDPYTKLVDESALELSVLKSEPTDTQFGSRESADGGDLTLNLAKGSYFGNGYTLLSTMASGTYVVAYQTYLMATNHEDSATIIWSVAGLSDIRYAEPAKVTNAVLSGKSTGYLTPTGETTKSREATWLVGDSPVLDGTSYTLYRDSNGTVLGTNVKFVGTNPFKDVAYVKSVNILTATGDDIDKNNDGKVDPASDGYYTVEMTLALLDQGVTVYTSIRTKDLTKLIGGTGVVDTLTGTVVTLTSTNIEGYTQDNPGWVDKNKNGEFDVGDTVFSAVANQFHSINEFVGTSSLNADGTYNGPNPRVGDLDYDEDGAGHDVNTDFGGSRTYTADLVGRWFQYSRSKASGEDDWAYTLRYLNPNKYAYADPFIAPGSYTDVDGGWTEQFITMSGEDDTLGTVGEANAWAYYLRDARTVSYLWTEGYELGSGMRAGSETWLTAANTAPMDITTDKSSISSAGSYANAAHNPRFVLDPVRGDWYSNKQTQVGASTVGSMDEGHLRVVRSYTEKLVLGKWTDAPVNAPPTATRGVYWPYDLKEDKYPTSIFGTWLRDMHDGKTAAGAPSHVALANYLSSTPAIVIHTGPVQGSKVGKVTDIGFLDPYILQTPREFGWFTGKITYQDYSKDYDVATFLIDGAMVDVKVPKTALVQDFPGFYNIVKEYKYVEEGATLYHMIKDTTNLDDSQEMDLQVYQLHSGEVKGTVINLLGSLYPWGQRSQWRDVSANGDTIGYAYTAGLGSEKSWAAWITLANLGSSARAQLHTYPRQTLVGSGETALSWIVPDRNYPIGDADERLGTLR